MHVKRVTLTSKKDWWMVELDQEDEKPVHSSTMSFLSSEETAKKEAIQVMLKSPRHAHLQSIDPSAPSKHFANITAKLPRRHSSLLFQLRSGHAPLNKHLFRIARSQTATCPQCNSAQESVHHFLLTCPSYTHQRNVMRHKLGARANHIKNLLNDPNCIKPMLEYVAFTCRLEAVFGDVTPPKDKDEE